MFYIGEIELFSGRLLTPFLPTKHRKWHLSTVSQDTSDVKRVVEVT
jgi:hypothetical protein